MCIDIHAGNEFSDRDRQGAAVLPGKTIGAIRGDRTIVTATTRRTGIIAIPVANRILSLSTGPAGLSSGPAVAVAAGIPVYVNIVIRHDSSPVSQ
ncbi:hypothetical protein IMCC9480_421 [Oxalobacteraceae bacterium IMCC9480]|nr:hypothetical protein IMCC9480_421 [Oxalobacteraceae bacterium IMCC9480]